MPQKLYPSLIYSAKRHFLTFFQAMTNFGIDNLYLCQQKF